MLTHMHKVVITCWYCHICKGGGVWAVERGLGSSPPSPRRACEAGFNAFVEVKCLFSFAPEARKGGEVTGVFLIKKHSSDAAPDIGCRVTRRVRWLTLVSAQKGSCTGASDSVAPDAGWSLLIVHYWWHGTRQSCWKCTGRDGASDGVASDASYNTSGVIVTK
jgi:hypothetical protein